MMNNDKKVVEAASPARPLIVLGVLKGYMKGASLFMLGTILTLPSFIKSCPQKYSKDFLGTAGFILHLYNRLQKKMSKEKAFELTRASLLTVSTSVMQANFRFVEEERNLNNLIKYQQETNRTGPTKANTMEVLEASETCYRFRVTRCMFEEFFSEMGAKELTSIMCSVDNAVFNSYLPNELVFERKKGETITEGCEYCGFCVKKV